jgi:hypothetical protein
MLVIEVLPQDVGYRSRWARLCSKGYTRPATNPYTAFSMTMLAHLLPPGIADFA